MERPGGRKWVGAGAQGLARCGGAGRRAGGSALSTAAAPWPTPAAPRQPRTRVVYRGTSDSSGAAPAFAPAAATMADDDELWAEVRACRGGCGARSR